MAIALVLLATPACGDDAHAGDAESADVAAPPDGDESDADDGDGDILDTGLDIQVADPDTGTAMGCEVRRFEQVGMVESEALNELSGLVASRAREGVYYAINDSGPALLYELDEAGQTLAEYSLEGADNDDFEDIALGPGPDGAPWVFVADVGDNMARTGGTPREEIEIYGFPEPADGDALTITDVRTFRFVYPGPSYDVEAVAIDGEGRVAMLTKESDVARLAVGVMMEGEASELTVGPPFPLRGMATAMDNGPRGLLVRSYPSILLFSNGSTIAERIEGGSVRIQPAGNEFQGEAIAWQAGDAGFLTAPEGLNAPINLFRCVNAAP